MAIGRNDPQQLKGVLPMLVLAELAKNSTYGYDLVQRLQAQGLEDISQGTVYPLLTRLEKDGQLTYQLITSPSGPARKNYIVTEQGKQQLEQSFAAWTALNNVVNTIMGDPS